MLSFVVAGMACAFAGLCYAELASTMPVAGSAYTYSYTTLGEVFAWVMGWLLVLEYGVAAATVAAGWSGNVVSLLANFGLEIPPELTTSFIQAVQGAAAGLTFLIGDGVQPARRARHPGGDRAAGDRRLGVGQRQQRHRVDQGRRAAGLHRHGHLLREPRQLAALHPGQRGRVQIRPAGHLPRRVGDLLRLRRLRGGLHRRGRGQEPAARHADRHPRLAVRLHDHLHGGRRGADRRGAVPRAGQRRPDRARGRPHGPWPGSRC